MGCAGFGRLWR